MSSEPVIRAADLAKRYRLWHSPSARIKAPLLAAAAERLHRRGRLAAALWRKAHTYFEDFYALREVSFEVAPGEALGIIGRNGSGKSTLLQMLAGTLQPSYGTVAVRGRVSAILELGTGFNAELTGRENVRLTATVQGVVGAAQAELIARVAEFAGIGGFFDQPVKNYSSGMFVRLAFAAAIAVEPDILILDEALAVGDTLFQSRCYRKMQELRQRGTTILFVSHDIFTVQSFCNRTLLLDRGRLVAAGPSRQVVQRYLNLLADLERQEWMPAAPPAAAAPAAPPDAEILAVEARDDRQQPTVIWETGGTGAVAVTVRFRRRVAQPVPGLLITTPSGVNVCGENAWYAGQWSGPQAAGAVLRTTFSLPVRLTPGPYLVTVAISEYTGHGVVRLDQRVDALHLRVTESGRSYVGVLWPPITIAYENLPAEGAP